MKEMMNTTAQSTINSNIVTDLVWTPIGKVDYYDNQRDLWIIEYYDKKVTRQITTEMLESKNGISLSNDCRELLGKSQKKICSECQNEPLYHEPKETYYCPVCDEI